MQKVLFLDRDGVINVEKNYLYKKEDFEFISGIFDLCRFFIQQGYSIFVVTNQSGIARGYYSEDDFLDLSKWMVERFAQEDVKIQEVYYCPHHPDITGECSCRKPKPGMLLKAKEKYALDMQNSWLIGDKERDIEAGIAAGVGKTVLFDEAAEAKQTKADLHVNKLEEIWKKYADT